MKKLTLCLSVLCLSALLLIGCTGQGEPSDTTTDTTVTEHETEPDTTPGTTADTEDETVPETGTEPVTEEVTTGYFDATHIDLVAPDTSKVIDMTVTGSGVDLYNKLDSKNGTIVYRYGPTYFYNEDGSVDAWMASVGAEAEWDWISYRHSNDGGKTFEAEKVVLVPSGGSMDRWSCCDPGVVYFDGWYYLGYTSTLNDAGLNNNVFVARSRKPDGPYEKWNGTHWGGNDPQPLLYQTESNLNWGIGEPSFVELNGTLYIYYTMWRTDGDYTMLATADAHDPDWPAHLTYHGAVVRKNTDSLDVKYIEDWGKFIAVGTGNRMGEKAWIGVYESNDGFTFTLVDVVREGTLAALHNGGISGRPNGHIRLSEDAGRLCVGYAWGMDNFGWNVRLQPISLVLSDPASIDMEAEKAKPYTEAEFIRTPPIPDDQLGTVMIRADRELYRSALGRNPITISIFTYDEYHTKVKVRSTSDIVFSDYDPNVVTFSGIKASIVGVGNTAVTATWHGFSCVFYIEIEEEYIDRDAVADPVEFYPTVPAFTICTAEADMYRPQLRAILKWLNGNFIEINTQSDKGEPMTWSGWDESVISVDEAGIITAHAVGETDITLTCRDMTATVHVTVTDDTAFAHYYPTGTH